MKKTLREELERIHSLTYGNQINEQEKQGFLDKIINKVDSNLKVKDNPKTADYVSPDVKDFFKTLTDASNSGGLTQQDRKTMTFQKGVESMQIGLILLGYELPRYGVDGLFGPETANAVRKFKQDNLQNLNESASELRTTLDQLGYDEKGSELSSGGEITKEISSIVSEILKQYKNAKPNVKVIATSGNDRFHKNLSYNSKHKTGQAVDITIQPYNTENANALITILNQFKSKDPKFSYIDEYRNPSKASTGGHFHLQYGEGGIKGSGSSGVIRGETASSEMLNKLIELLSQKNITSEDLKKYVDKYDLNDLVDKNFYAKLLENLGAPVTEENLKFLYAWRQAEGSGGKYNPFNTTHRMPGAVSINDHGVKSYRTIEDGMVATIKTLRNGRYNCIVNGLINNIGADRIAQCESLKTWGTGDLVKKVVAGYNRGSSPNIKPLV